MQESVCCQVLQLMSHAYMPHYTHHMFDLPHIARGSSVTARSLFEQMHLNGWGTPISI